jgi:hypothetical protein
VRSKVSILLVVSLLILSVDLPAKERRGAEVVVTKNDGQVLKGELIAVKPDSLLLISATGKDESVRVADIATIRIVKKSKAGRGFLIGFVPGAAVGAIWGISMSDETKLLAALVGGLIVGAATGLVGLAFGAVAGLDSEIRLSGLPESELARILANLDGQARKPGVFIPKPIEPTVRELGVKPAR